MEMFLWVLFILYWVVYFIIYKVEMKKDYEKYSIPKWAYTTWSMSVKPKPSDFVQLIGGLLIAVGLVLVTQSLILTIIAWLFLGICVVGFFIAVMGLGKPEKSRGYAIEIMKKVRKEKHPTATGAIVMNVGNNEKCPNCKKNGMEVMEPDRMKPTWLHFRCFDCGYSGTFCTEKQKVIDSELVPWSK